jgi:hypothetical protein
MSTKTGMLAAVVLATLAGSAAAADTKILFSFADPVRGTPLRFSQSPTSGMILITYDAPANFTFNIGSDDGSIGPIAVPGVHLDMQLLAPGSFATALPDVLITQLAGSFTFYTLDVANNRTDLLRGDINPQLPGTLALFATNPTTSTGSMWSSSDAPHSLVYTPGPGLLSLVPAAAALAPRFDGSFSLSNITLTPGGPSNDGTFARGNTSFSGSALLVPTPGAMGLMVLGGVLVSRRRRA